MTMITIEPVDAAALDSIMELELAGFEAGERWSASSWADELAGEGRSILAGRATGGELLGVIVLRATGEIADLHRIVVDPGRRRQGVGRQLLTAGIEAVRAAGVRSILAEVRYDNEAAIDLYQRAGFEQLGSRADYYGPGRHALILKLYDLDLDHGSERS